MDYRNAIKWYQYGSSFPSSFLRDLVRPRRLPKLSSSLRSYQGSPSSLFRFLFSDNSPLTFLFSLPSPSQWFIVTMSWIGQATHLKAFPANEIAKGQYTMKLKQLVDSTKDMKWPVSNDHLPIVSWEDCELCFSPRPRIASR